VWELVGVWRHGVFTEDFEVGVLGIEISGFGFGEMAGGIDSVPDQ
jgi:hypothetical protein